MKNKRNLLLTPGLEYLNLVALDGKQIKRESAGREKNMTASEIKSVSAAHGKGPIVHAPVNCPSCLAEIRGGGK